METNIVDVKEVGAPVESCPKSPLVVGYSIIDVCGNKLCVGGSL